MAPGTPEKRPGRRSREAEGYRPVLLVAAPGRCPECGANLVICQTRRSRLQTFQGSLLLIEKDRKCSNKLCSKAAVRYRPDPSQISELRLKVKRREYGLDVIAFIGESRLHNSVSFPKIYEELVERGIMISARHVENLFRLFLALSQARNGELEAVRNRLQDQGRLVLQIDAVQFDEVSPRLYVVREVLSREILYAERITPATAENLTLFLMKVRTLGIPVAGIVTDKEAALVKAVQAVFPGAPHQYCQTHYLGRLVEKCQVDLKELGGWVTDVARGVRDFGKLLKSERPKATENPQDRAAAEKICKIVDTVAKCSGDKLFAPTPLKRYQRLAKVVEELKAALSGREQKRWPLLNHILTLLLVLTEVSALGERLGRQFARVRKIAHILNKETTGRQVKRLLRTYLNRLKLNELNSAPEAEANLIQNLIEVSDRWWKGLFTFYDVPDLPANNNELERTFGSLKQAERRAHGRKSTAGGPLERCAPVMVAVWSQVQSRPSLLELLQDVPQDKLEEIQKLMDEGAEPARLRRSIARDFEKHLTDALDLGT